MWKNTITEAMTPKQIKIYVSKKKQENVKK